MNMNMNMKPKLTKGYVDGATASVKSLATLIRTNSGLSLSLGFGLRRRKNFSLLLLAGLGALLCALYYTTYYPSTVWTLRLGFTSFNGTKKENINISNPIQSGKDSEGDPPSELNLLEKLEKVKHHPEGNDGDDGGGPNDQVPNLRRYTTDTTTNSKSNGLQLGSMAVNEYGHGRYNSDKPQKEDGLLDDSPKSWDWRRWFSTGYWKVNSSGEEYDGNDDQFQADSRVSPAPEPRHSSSSHRPRRKSQLVCNFPRLKAFDPSILEFIKSPPNIDCSKEYPLVFRSNFQQKLILWGHPFLREETTNYSCCYKTIARGNGSDHNIIYSKRCYPITKVESDIPPEHEFISIRCRTIPHSNPPQSPSSSPKTTSGNEGPGLKESKHDTGPNNLSTNDNTNIAKSTPKLYKDMLPFVPLKPAVEARVRKYAESRRKSQYAKKRMKDFEKVPGEEEGLSVLILGLDAQSHMNFIRQMPLTYQFLTKNLSSIGLHGYTKVGDNTFPNVVTLLSGLTVDELEKVCWPTKQSYFDSCPFIWKDYAELGYRTSLAEDSVWMGTFNYEKKGFLHPPTDYYLHPLSLLMAKKIGHESWANAKLCYGPRLAFEVLLDYIVKTAVTFRNSLYFQFVWANSLFHDYLNNPRLGDEMLAMTLDFLEKNNFLQKTIFILLSDHGIRWGSIRSTYQGKIEERMPLAYFTFPQWFREKYPEAMRNLRRNVWRLTTPFDIYETLKDILSLSQGNKVDFGRWTDSKNSDNMKAPRGISVLRPVPLERTCKMAGIEEHWCVCNKMEKVPLNSSLVQSGAQFVLDIINGLVRKHGGLCAKLSILKINEAKRKIDGDIDRGLDVDFLPSQNTGSMSESEKREINGTTTPESGNPSNNAKRRRRRNLVTSESKVMGLSTSSDIKKMIQLQITMVTQPGDGVFEATIYGEVESQIYIDGDKEDEQEQAPASIKGRENHHWKLSGDISRLNLYGSQSACVTDYKVQKYCYCIAKAQDKLISR